ncbi:MAG: hypothetical protein ACRYFR_09745 [Janthinobacterium lividum]
MRIAKEFVKLNERCFARLLGDMRAYNYVIDVTPDFEDEQYRVRAIDFDFDQQSYEGNRRMYQPRYFADSAAVVDLCARLLKPENVRQYQTEERTLMARRARTERHLLRALLDVMRQHALAPTEKVAELRGTLARYHQSTAFAACDSMGDVVRLHLWLMLGPGARPPS